MGRRIAKDDQNGLWNAFKRRSIQEAVIRLMFREGLAAVTMERVAQEVGIAKGTVYLHYKDKQELLDDVKDSALDPLMAKLDEIFRGDGTPERKLQQYALRYLGYLDERRDLFRILLYEREVTRVQGSRFRGDRYRLLVEETAAVIEAGVADGSFRDVVDPRSIAAMFVESNFAMLNQRLLTDKPRSVEEDAELIADLFLRGLRRRGR
jgi:AcrR family transcriptional regulator